VDRQLLSAHEPADSWRLQLTDELGVSARSIFYAVEVVERRRRYRGTRLRLLMTGRKFMLAP
jgi:hypothetical protein